MDLDPPRRRLLELIASHDTDLATVSRAIGRNHAYLQQYLKRGTPRSLPEEARERLAAHFGARPDEFRAEPAARLGAPPVPPAADGDVVQIAGEDYALLPVFDLRLSAGPGAWVGDHAEPLYYEPHRQRWLRSITTAPVGSLIIARVDGDSMEATLRSGDQVLLDLTRNKPTRDGIYGLRQGDELMVKRLAVDPRSGAVTVISDNPHYPTWPDVAPDAIDVIGRVIWLGRQV